MIVKKSTYELLKERARLAVEVPQLKHRVKVLEAEVEYLREALQDSAGHRKG